ncbi:MAG: endonuclease/exonuclease/phosphatase family protein [Verrucomicrobiia bacterium]
MWFNLRNYLRDETPGEDLERKTAPDPETHREAVARMILLGQPDLLAVGEIGDDDDLRDLQDRLSKAGLSFPHTTRLEAAEGGRHLAFLSRWPVLSHGSTNDVLLDPSQSRLRMRRGILDVTVGLETAKAKGSLRIVAVHLKSRRPVPQDEAVLRRLEAGALRKHLDAIASADSEAPLLVCGDFNATRDSEEMREVMGVRGGKGYLHEVKLEDDRGLRWTYFHAESDTYERIDFMLVNKAARRMIAPERSTVLWDPDWFTASDHRPLVITLRLAPLQSP